MGPIKPIMRDATWTKPIFLNTFKILKQQKTKKKKKIRRKKIILSLRIYLPPPLLPALLGVGMVRFGAILSKTSTEIETFCGAIRCDFKQFRFDF